MPTHSYSLAPAFPSLAALGATGKALLFLVLLAGILFFCLSFTSRYGRSRWPLHALIGTCLFGLAAGMFFTSIGLRSIGALGTELKPGAPAPDPVVLLDHLSTAPFWFGLVAALLALMALVRACFGMIREPGPRF